MKSAAKVAALGIGLGLAAAGCGSGTVIVGMISPTITQVSPQVVTAGTPSVTVTVQGSNFQSQASVTVNGSAMPTTVVNSTTLAAKISGSTLAQPAVAHLQVKNTDGASSNEVPLTVTSASQNATLAISTSGLPGAQSGTAYSSALTASGGTPAYSWSISSGSLPAGLSLSSNGAILGTPTGSGTFTFGVTVSDSSSPAQSQTVTLSIVVLPATPAPPALSITSAALGSGQVGSAYSASLSATGGTPSYSWSLSSGSLPAGLTLSNGGVISGTPTASGTSTFTVALKDSGSPAQSASGQVSITVAPAGLSVHSVSLGAGVEGSSYSTTLTATGGTPGYAWSLASGSLPAGLTLSPSGIISGTPTASGTATFTVRVSDSGSPAQTASAQESLTIAAANLAVTSTSLSSGKEGSSYSTTLSASGGTPGYTWSLASGSLPAGLTLSNAGVISGTPTGSGTATFTVAVADSGSPQQTASIQESLTIAAPGLTITSTTLAAGTTGSSYNVSLSANGGTPGYTWSISSGNLPAGLTISSSGVISGAPTAAGNATFTIAVKDSGSPAQSASAQESINVTSSTPSLTITTTSLPSGQSGNTYSTSLSASGGNGSYSWSITSGSLPAGLSFNSDGTISGTPNASGTASFTVQVADTETPAAMQTANLSIAVTAAPTGPGTTWYVRPDGGTRYSNNVPLGQCDGKADVPYPGSGVDQHCAFNDFRYLWDDQSGQVGAGAWVIAGGDTVIIRGCAASANQANPSAPDCRIGWDGPTGPLSNNWCYAVGSYTCYNPPIPAGSPTQHTRILGQNYANCNAGGATNPKDYASNLTQIFGGFSLVYVFNLQNTQNVDIQCIELTTHNGVCDYGVGAPTYYPRECSNNPPLDDYAQNGFLLNNQSSNIDFQDVYVHGFDSSGFDGPIGGAITMTRVYSGFNAFSGWNFDDGNDTPDAPGSSINASYVTMIGNGCYEEYPIVHTAYPARACFDDNNGGFGDAWSGQDTELDSFICDHCVMMYNTKDAFIGPHTQVKNMVITNSVSIGNMGAQWKWGQTTNATLLFQNNLTVTNCYRMSEALPGAAQNYNQSTGLAGSYLSDFCRAGGSGFAIITQPGSNDQFLGNTIIGASSIIFQQNCGYSSAGEPFTQVANCSSASIVLEDNNFLGYTDPNVTEPTALYYVDPGTTVNFTASFNNEYGLKAGTTDNCGTNDILCSDPLLVNEPAQTWPGSETALDVFNPFISGNSFTPTSSSPLLGAGIEITGMPTDYFEVTRPANPTIGAVEP